MVEVGSKLLRCYCVVLLALNGTDTSVEHDKATMLEVSS